MSKIHDRKTGTKIWEQRCQICRQYFPTQMSALRRFLNPSVGKVCGHCQAIRQGRFGKPHR